MSFHKIFIRFGAMGDGNFAHCTAVTIYLFSLFSFTFSSCPFSEQTYSSCLSHAELFLTFQCHSLRAGQVLLWACSPRHIPSKYNLPSLSPRGLQGRIVFPFSFFLVFFSQVASFPLISNRSPTDINLLVLIFMVHLEMLKTTDSGTSCKVFILSF